MGHLRVLISWMLPWGTYRTPRRNSKENLFVTSTSIKGLPVWPTWSCPVITHSRDPPYHNNTLSDICVYGNLFTVPQEVRKTLTTPIRDPVWVLIVFHLFHGTQIDFPVFSDFLVLLGFMPLKNGQIWHGLTENNFRDYCNPVGPTCGIYSLSPFVCLTWDLLILDAL